jgi:hypothetical protein
VTQIKETFSNLDHFFITMTEGYVLLYGRREAGGPTERGYGPGRTWVGTLLMPLALLGSPAALSSNGLNQIGFGAVSMGMGGADIAVSRDTSALNVNPAGLTQIDDRRLDLITAVAYTGNVHHKDSFGNDTGTDREYAVLNDAGAAARLGD